MFVTAFAVDPQCVKPLVGAGSPKGRHEFHLISTTYICGGSAGSWWGRRTGGGQWRCSRGCGWGPRCVPTGRRMGWTCIIVCHGAHVIINVQTHLICYLTCLLHGVVMHGCVTLTRCGHRCLMPTRCGMLTTLMPPCP